ncbi:hypothetical protein FOA52_010627 [Chlamydomonas sp. UWO 241]|nr:hypothetical protein FOA52_010627 [Chlamydomonas sp. UWO 241]
MLPSLLRHHQHQPAMPPRARHLTACTSSNPSAGPASTTTDEASHGGNVVAIVRPAARPVALPDGADELPYYSQYPLDRKAEWRGNAGKLAELLARPDARLLLLSRDKAMVRRIAPDHGSAAVGKDAADTGNPDEARWTLAAACPASTALSQLHSLTAAAKAPPSSASSTSPSSSAASSSSSPSSGSSGSSNSSSSGSSGSGNSSGSSGGGAAETDGGSARDLMFLGVDAKGAPTFALDVRSADGAAAFAEAHQAEWASVRALELQPGEACLAATAVALSQWARAAVFSSGTAERLEAAVGGFARRIIGATRTIWPRVDPAVIMLTTTGRQIPPPPGTAAFCPASGAPLNANEWCLLGRKPAWPEGRYSTLAGFVEVGEPLELTVAREVEEESAVPVDLRSVRYVASQPWPFPRSLMIGFYARAREGVPAGSGYELLGREGRNAALDVGITREEVEAALLPHLPATLAQEDEMADTRWFHRDYMAATAAAPEKFKFHIPGRYSLASRLINGWLAGASSAETGPALGAGAAASGARNEESGGWAGDALPQVNIDAGTFKYVLMRLRTPDGSRSKLLVWGDTHAAFHNHVFQAAKSDARAVGLEVDELGGGRIAHEPGPEGGLAGAVHIYGHSAAFGPAPHEVAAALVRRWYPFAAVSISYDGY